MDRNKIIDKNMLTKIFRKIHRILGLLLSILFLMWFISGIVMIYHSFPRVNQKLKLARQESLTGPLPAVDSLLQVLPDSSRLGGLSVDMYLDRPVFHLKGRQLPAGLYADSLQVVGKPDFNEICRIAGQLGGSVAYRVDSLNRLDQWIPFGYLTKEFPIYKFSFEDDARQEMYISSKSGKVLQWTDRNSRFWAWLGAIPHWVYFTSLRQNQALWINFMIWASGLGAIMCFSGLWIGIWVFWKNRKKGLRSPYKKWWLRCHHIIGVVFGVFALTFVFSGMMSLVDIPSWMQKGKTRNREVRFRGREGGMLAADLYALDYRKIVDSLSDVKSIEWASFGKYPYYVVNSGSKKQFIDAADTSRLSPFTLTEEMVRETVREIHGQDTPYTLEWMTDWDDDYFSRRNMLTLPVYKVVIDDELHTRHYFNPETLYHRQIDDNGRLRGVLYSGLHSLNFKFLAERPLLWNVVMYVLMLGGTFLSLSGVVLTFKWLGRKIRKLFR